MIMGSLQALLHFCSNSAWLGCSCIFFCCCCLCHVTQPYQHVCFHSWIYDIITMTIPQIAVNHNTFGFSNYPSVDAILAIFVIIRDKNCSILLQRYAPWIVSLLKKVTLSNTEDKGAYTVCSKKLLTFKRVNIR